MVSVNARFTEDTDVSNSAESGFRNTLHAYTAPSATCITTPAAAISQRFVTFSGMIDPQRLCGLDHGSTRSEMEQRLSLITLGVADVPRARAFYEALGWTCNTDPAIDVAFFQLGGIVLAVWDRANLAEDSTVTDGGGWGGVTLAYNVRSPEEVDAALAEAQAAGAMIGRPGATTFWGGYSGVFVDPDGHPWEVAHNPRWTIEPDGSVRI